MVISGVSATGYVGCVAEKKTKAKPPEEWADWVKRAREAAELTQEQFAEKIDYSRGAVADWERRENAIELPAVVRIMAVFPHSPAPPIRGFSERPPVVKIVPPPAPPPLPLEAAEVAQYMMEVEPKFRKQVRDAIARHIPIVLASISAGKATR